MKILREIPWDDLEEMIRKVPLKKPDAEGKLIFAYTDAKIELREVDPNELNPTSFYIISKKRAFQRELREQLLKEGYDSLQLRGGLEIENDAGEFWRLIPPVVEMMRERVLHDNVRGDIIYPVPTHVNVACINDGLHRVDLAREIKKNVVVAHISGIPEKHPFYALPNGWDEVKVFDDTPKTMAEKKMYRCNDSYALYRDFDVLGCGKPRNTGTGAKV